MAVASLSLSLISTVCTADRFCLNTEGNEEAFVLVRTVCDEVSELLVYSFWINSKDKFTSVFGATACARQEGIGITS